MTSSIAEFRTAFEALGYRRALDYKTFGKSDRWYVFDRGTRAVTHVAYLAYRPAYRAYAPAFGMFNPITRMQLIAALPAILPYLHPTYSNSMWPLDQRPCWMLFYAAQQLGWESMCVPDPREPENWPARLSEVVDKILQPTFWPAQTSAEVRSLLLRKEREFDWRGGLSVLRAAEIISLSKELSFDDASIRRDLAEHEPSIVRDMYGSKDINGMLSTFLRLL